MEKIKQINIKKERIIFTITLQILMNLMKVK